MKRLRLLVALAAVFTLGILVTPVNGQAGLIISYLNRFVASPHTWTAAQTFNTITVSGCTGCGGGGGLPIAAATLTISDTQMKALPSTPLVIVAGPGLGKYLVPVMAMAETAFSAGAYTNVTDSSLNQGASDVVVTYGPNFINAFRAWPMGALNGGNPVKVGFSAPTMGVSAPVVVTDQLWAPFFGFSFNGMDRLENDPLYVAADNTGNFTGGGVGNQLVVTVYYITRSYQSATP